MQSKVRLQKHLAEAGMGSRRACEEIITAGRVTINGHRVSQLGTCVDPANDEVKLDGRVVRPLPKIYLAVNKPRGCVCSRKDEDSRPLLADLLPAEHQNLFHVGRLDWDSEGLILMTNDGEFALRVTHPRYQVLKIYEVDVEGAATAAALAPLERGIWDKGEMLRAKRFQVQRSRPAASTIEIELTEGKNREVRRMMMALGFKVRRLRRVRIGPIRLGCLQVANWRSLTASEVRLLLHPV